MPAIEEARSNRRSCSKLRAAGNETVGDAGTEFTEAEKGQRGEHDRHRIVDGRRAPPKPAVNSENNAEPIPMMTASARIFWVTKSWMARMKKASRISAQAKSRHAIWMVSRRRRPSPSVGKGSEQRASGVEAGLCRLAGAQQVGRRALEYMTQERALRRRGRVASAVERGAVGETAKFPADLDKTSAGAHLNWHSLHASAKT